jgi:hypothetical protein
LKNIQSGNPARMTLCRAAASFFNSPAGKQFFLESIFFWSRMICMLARGPKRMEGAL